VVGGGGGIIMVGVVVGYATVWEKCAVPMSYHLVPRVTTVSML
jgi:hypothetical protein